MSPPWSSCPVSLVVALQGQRVVVFGSTFLTVLRACLAQVVLQVTVLLQLVPAPQSQVAGHCPLVAPPGQVLDDHPMKNLATVELEEVAPA